MTTSFDAIRRSYRQTEVGIIPDDWDVQPLGALTLRMTNGFVGPAIRHYTNSTDGILYIQGYNIKENSFEFHGIKYVTQEFHKRNMKSCLRVGDMLTVQTGDVGLTAVVSEKIAGSNCHALIISRFDKNKVQSNFISFYLNSEPGRSRLRLIETGTTMKHLNVGDMLFFLVPLPPTLAEQQAIAEALGDADAWIESLEKLIAKKRDLKQAAMQQLLTGKMRLPGYAGEWEIKPIGKVAPLQRGFDLPNALLRSGRFPVVYSNGIANYHRESRVKGPGVVTGRSGTIGNVTFVEDDFWPHNTSLWVTNFNGNDERFIYYLYTTLSFEQFATGSGVPTLNRNNVHEFKVHLPPSRAEQQAIAGVFADIDSELAILGIKLAKAKQIKQGMMQQLLTGMVRLV
ncbi:restriction endonuclease subunit S [Blastopirellula sp. J2-11]|uniref:restriction endonuclease subunit S n=1 Tax=Blastopirellula sp. J2-11 TaxID=2943192 RepID=UPI0021C82F13|nr:restriction endonuclease subunit S [Blastopirellula sp. J2-11]UUO08102.1 restriction endonuclease subunit S [Blastopirellula sp. J2-11]